MDRHIVLLGAQQYHASGVCHQYGSAWMLVVCVELFNGHLVRPQPFDQFCQFRVELGYPLFQGLLCVQPDDACLGPWQ